MAVDYSSLLYGTAPTRSELRAQKPTQQLYDGNYQEMYNQQRTMPRSGFAAGSADWLANYVQQNVQAQRAGMSPVNFNALLGPDGTVDTSKAPFEGLPTLEEIQQQARTQYETSRLQQVDLARQSAMRGGADQYSQARMAMEQQRALSDTRGLTAGAAEGAQQQLSAAQQVALNQIESGTLNRLDQLDSFAAQIPIEAMEFAQKELDFKLASDPRTRLLDSPDPEIAAKAYGSLYGLSAEEIDDLVSELSGTTIGSVEYNMKIESTIDRQLTLLAGDANLVDSIFGFGIQMLGTGAVATGLTKMVIPAMKGLGVKWAGSNVLGAGIVGKLAGIGLAPFLAKAVIVAGVAYLGFQLVKGVMDYQTKAKDPVEKTKMVKDMVREQTEQFKAEGFTDRQIRDFWTRDLASRGYGPNLINEVLGTG